MPGTLTLKSLVASARVEAPEVRATDFKRPDGTSLTGDLELAVYGPRVTAVATALQAVADVRLIARTEPDTAKMILHAAYAQHNNLGAGDTLLAFPEGTTTENKLANLEQFLTHVAAREILYEQPAAPSSTTFSVTFQMIDGENKYFVDAQQQPTLNLNEGNTYVFDWSGASAHPFRFSTTSDGTHVGGVEYTTGVIVDATSYTTTITVAASAPPLFYYCQHHSGMGGQATTPAPATEVRRGTPQIGTFDASLSIGQRLLRVENALETLTRLRTMRVGSNGTVSLGEMTSAFVVGGGGGNLSISDTFDAADDINAPTMKAVFTFLTDAGLSFSDGSSEAGETGGTEAEESTGTTSDIRLKSNLTPIHEAMETIRKLSPQTYDKFESIPATGKSHPDAGFVAQHIETVPELARFVITPPEDAPKRLNYSALFTHAVAAIQELDRLVQDQAARISALEGQQ